MENEIDVKSIRKTHRLTQQGLADAVGVNLSTVWRWENGSPPRGAARTFLQRLAGEASIISQDGTLISPTGTSTPARPDRRAGA